MGLLSEVLHRLFLWPLAPCNTNGSALWGAPQAVSMTPCSMQMLMGLLSEVPHRLFLWPPWSMQKPMRLLCEELHRLFLWPSVPCKHWWICSLRCSTGCFYDPLVHANADGSALWGAPQAVSMTHWSMQMPMGLLSEVLHRLFLWTPCSMQKPMGLLCEELHRLFLWPPWSMQKPMGLLSDVLHRLFLWPTVPCKHWWVCSLRCSTGCFYDPLVHANADGSALWGAPRAVSMTHCSMQKPMGLLSEVLHRLFLSSLFYANTDGSALSCEELQWLFLWSLSHANTDWVCSVKSSWGCFYDQCSMQIPTEYALWRAPEAVSMTLVQCVETLPCQPLCLETLSCGLCSVSMSWTG